MKMELTEKEYSKLTEDKKDYIEENERMLLKCLIYVILIIVKIEYRFSNIMENHTLFLFH